MSDVRGLDSALGSALQGIQRTLRSAAENASKIAGAADELGGTGNLVEPIIDLTQDLRHLQAIGKVVNLVDEMNDEVLDIIA